MLGRADLHAHTTCSDGTVSPVELVNMAVERHLSAVAITDHDICSGYQEAAEVGLQLGVQVISGVELSASEGEHAVDVLGYFVDATDVDFAQTLARLRIARTARIQQMVERLIQMGAPLTMEQVLEESGGGTVGRPHLARVLVKLGWVTSVQDAFAHFLGKQGSCYVPKVSFSVMEAATCIRSAGGVAVLAHPRLIHDDTLVEFVLTQGLSGLEVWHPEHDQADRERYQALAARYGLIMTGGSDFHGAAAKHRGDLGSETVPLSTVRALASLAKG